MRQLLLGLIIVFPFSLFGQNGIKTTSLTNQTKEELIVLVKDLYDIEVNISFNITLKDLKSTFEDMSDGTKYDKTSLNDLLQKMGSDSLNSIHLNNIADYYSKNMNAEFANKYYSKALKNLDIKYFNNDSAFYYSLRGLLKANLNDSTAIYDFSKSVEINPNDSISMYFYPMILISSGKYQKARELTKALFKSHVDNVSFPYFYLALSIIFESFQSILESINKEKDYKKEYANKNYNEIINYTLLDEYLIKYKGNIEIENCRLMADLLGLFYKVIVFEQDSNYKLILNYTEYEKNRIREIISSLNEIKKEKKLNEYTANRCLGYAYFMLDEWDKSVDYLKNAIETFPIEKQDFYFSSIDCYDAITTIYFQKSDAINFRKALKTKISIQTDEFNKLDELTLLAFDYYLGGDLVKAEEYCMQIREINPDNFDALRLLSHVNFLKDSQFLTEFYGERASKNYRNDLDYYSLIMQFAIYQIYNGDFNTATNNIEVAKKIKNADDCSLCDKLMKIIEDNK